jgi:hypothetical protein
MSQRVATDRPMHGLRATAGEVPRSWSRILHHLHETRKGALCADQPDTTGS